LREPYVRSNYILPVCISDHSDDHDDHDDDHDHDHSDDHDMDSISDTYLFVASYSLCPIDLDTFGLFDNSVVNNCPTKK
jgi:hypothetical protein